MQRILVPIDRRKDNGPVLRALTELARPGEGTVILLHVIETIQDVAYDDLVDFYEELASQSKEALALLAQELAQAGIESETMILFGNRVREILRVTDEQEIDLVVLNSHRVDLERPASESFATISYQIAVLCGCSVLLVK